ncbi:unnamed protein product [Cylindrotheca closterium]|uniref:Uncharacterized protein n=1 Tax=Cylindrotheca closterium TaxID=2856 RepID=A0AAD2FMJ1_9STRA|nr:unnamed protein product [Cylindrotheca closterium]
MRRLVQTKQSLGLLTGRLTEDDDVSFDGVSSNQLSTSFANDYDFSENDEDEKSMGDSLYFDESRREEAKMKPANQLTQPPSSGALEGLVFSTQKPNQEQKTAKVDGVPTDKEEPKMKTGKLQKHLRSNGTILKELVFPTMPKQAQKQRTTKVDGASIDKEKEKMKMTEKPVQPPLSNHLKELLFPSGSKHVQKPEEKQLKQSQSSDTLKGWGLKEPHLSHTRPKQGQTQKTAIFDDGPVAKEGKIKTEKQPKPLRSNSSLEELDSSNLPKQAHQIEKQLKQSRSSGTVEEPHSSTLPKQAQGAEKQLKQVWRIGHLEEPVSPTRTTQGLQKQGNQPRSSGDLKDTHSPTTRPRCAPKTEKEGKQPRQSGDVKEPLSPSRPTHGQKKKTLIIDDWPDKEEEKEKKEKQLKQPPFSGDLKGPLSQTRPKQAQETDKQPKQVLSKSEWNESSYPTRPKHSQKIEKYQKKPRSSGDLRKPLPPTQPKPIEKEGEKKKTEKKMKQSRSSITFEELYSLSDKELKKKTAKMSSKSQVNKSLSSSDHVSKKSSNKAASTHALFGGCRDLKSLEGSDHRNQNWNISSNGEDLKLVSGGKEESLRHDALVEKALKRSLAKKRALEALSLSHHRIGREEVAVKGQRSLSGKRYIDALSLASHTKDRTELMARNRRTTTKKSSLDGSSTSDHRRKRSSSVKRPSKSTQCDEKSHRAASGLGHSGHSERSSSVTRKKKDLNRSSHSTTAKRSSSAMKKKKIQGDRSNHVSEYGQRSFSKCRLPEAHRSLSPGSAKQHGGQVPLKMPLNAGDEMISRKLSNMSLHYSEHGSSERSPRVGKDGDKDNNVKRKMHRRNSSSACL